VLKEATLGHRVVGAVPSGLWRAVVVLLAGSCLAIEVAASAAARGTSMVAQRGTAAVLKLHFERRGSAQWAWTNDRYAFASDPHVMGAAGQVPGTLLDERTGRSTRLSHPGCQPLEPGTAAAINDPWLLFPCDWDGHNVPTPELYSLAGGDWTTVTPSQQLVNCNGSPCNPLDSMFSVVAAGSNWLEFIRQICPEGLHCSAESLFQNISTGELRSDPTRGATIADPNSPSLVHTVCKPLHVMKAPTGEQYLGRSALSFYGRFAIADSVDKNGDQSTYLEHCDSRLHMPLTHDPYPYGRSLVGANPTSVIWASPKEVNTRGGAKILSGVTLPKLRRFAVPLPAALQRARLYELALTSQRLYVISGDHLWTATLPRSLHTT